MESYSLNFKDVILKHKKCSVESRSACDASAHIANNWALSPVICANMPAVLNRDICKIFDDAGWFHVYHRLGQDNDIKNYIEHSNAYGWNYKSISIGIKQTDFDLVNWVAEQKFILDAITIDIAFSWQDQVEKLIKHIKATLPHTYLIVGNGDNPDWIKWLIDLNVDCAKINIGVSSACRTREYTGFGSTTITDLINCKEAAGDKIKIMSDGGLTRLPDGDIAIGDVAKAIKFGADFVMSGALFSQCIDSPALLNSYYGNSTARAKGHSKHVEGAEITVKTNGRTIAEQIKLVEDSLKSSISYSGGRDLSALRNVDYQIVK
jgi:GMP reductase